MASDSYTLTSNDQLLIRRIYNSLIITQKNNVPLRLSSLGRAIEGVENASMAGWNGTKPAVLLIVFKQPDANVIETVDRIRAVLPQPLKVGSAVDKNSAHQRPHHDHSSFRG